MKRNYLRFFAAGAVLMVGIAVNGFAQTSPGAINGITIKNFGQMDTNYYRGGQPKKEEFRSLKALGVATVIDLQKKPKKYEKAAVEALGMRYINIPMADDKYPDRASIARFLELMNDPETGIVFVHCKGGKHRAGVTGAAYRISKYGWDYDQTYKEMLNYKFHTKWGRKPMKQFVIDYAAKMKADPEVARNAAAN